MVGRLLSLFFFVTYCDWGLRGCEAMASGTAPGRGN